MSFALNLYHVYLPVLKVGHYIQIGNKFYSVVEVKKFPFPTGSLSGTGERYDFKETTDSKYQVLVGNLNVNRVVHLRYLALTETQDTYLYWLTDPFTGTKEQEIAVSSTYVNTSHPLEFNKWSYDKEMYASAKWASGTTQGFVWEVAIYKVQEIPTTPAEYLKITSKGDASFVKAR